MRDFHYQSIAKAKLGRHLCQLGRWTVTAVKLSVAAAAAANAS